MEGLGQKTCLMSILYGSLTMLFARNPKACANFAENIKKNKYPVYLFASPLTITEEKMKILIDAGLIYLQMGVESGSRNVQEVFNRKNMSNERMMKAIEIINKYKEKCFHQLMISFLTYYETDEDKVESLRFISEIPKPFRLQPFSLVLYPGTLYQMAKADGIIW